MTTGGPINLINTLKGFSDGWVAISKDYKKVRYSGQTFLQVMKKVEKDHQQDQVIVFPVAKSFRGFVGQG